MSALLSALRSTPRLDEPDAVAQSLYERHSDRVLGYCRRFLRDRVEAEDACQTTYLFALLALRRGVSPDFELAWLLGIARNVCLTRLQASGRRDRVEKTCDSQLLAETATGPDLLRDEMMSLEEALADLTEPQRKAIVLREWQGLSYREIAEALGLTLAAVETHIFRARRALARNLSEGAPDPGRRRALAALDLGGWLVVLKSALGGGAALKLGAAATAAALVGSGALATRALEQRGEPAPVVPSAPASRVDVEGLGTPARAAEGEARPRRERESRSRPGPAAASLDGVTPSATPADAVTRLVPVPVVPELPIELDPTPTLPVEVPTP